MTKDKFQPSNGYAIPENGIEILNEGKTVAVRYDIAKCEEEKADDGEALPQQYEANFIRIPRSEYNYAGLVSAMVEDKYPSDQMQAVINNYLVSPDEGDHTTAFTEMQEWRAHAKEVAKAILAMV